LYVDRALVKKISFELYFASVSYLIAAGEVPPAEFINLVLGEFTKFDFRSYSKLSRIFRVPVVTEGSAYQISLNVNSNLKELLFINELLRFKCRYYLVFRVLNFSHGVSPVRREFTFKRLRHQVLNRLFSVLVVQIKTENVSLLSLSEVHLEPKFNCQGLLDKLEVQVNRLERKLTFLIQ
jgi:hypothetical protein